MAKPQLYDRIGVGYQQARMPDPRIASQVLDALGDAETVLNVGAGTGNYEPTDRYLVAAEPNSIMLSQRASPAPAVQAFAEALPFAANSFDATMATLTLHHWPDRVAGLRELQRVSNRQVIWLYDTAVTAGFWLGDYYPSLSDGDAGHPTPEWLEDYLDVFEVRTVEVPWDCTDGFAGAYWRRPERYLDPVVQAGMSIFSWLPAEEAEQGNRSARSRNRIRRVG